MPKSIRDLVQGWNPEPNPTVRDCAEGYRTEYAPLGKSPYAHTPGDQLEHVSEFEMDGPVSAERMLGKDFHLGPQGMPKNPMPELGGPLEVSRALREGKIPFKREREIRDYLQRYQSFVGQTLYDPQHHVLNVPEDEEPGYGGVHRADKWPR